MGLGVGVHADDKWMKMRDDSHAVNLPSVDGSAATRLTSI